ncbi:GfdT protein [Billgrantia diversa]|uniref:nitric oxide-sensing protein NosP n=1 Tax=Halomonas sp. MCCC 1A13316 TaxID=2733487 RepID=UPI0018A414D7|nr:nitric oxide-sensing protein NosP [Halomonas sp. MCCC 1A13316]QOR39843.1 GfdT protein [Halomonas sp. MCCC 1A13316]
MDLLCATPAEWESRHDGPAVRTAFSEHCDPAAAACELAESLTPFDLGFVLFFCSAEYPLDALGRALSEAFPSVTTAGCTTAGEITPKGYCRGGVVALGFGHRNFSVACELIDDLAGFDLIQAQRLSGRLLEECRRSAPPGTGRQHFVMTLLDGLSSSEEQVLATLDTALGSIPSFGGSAGDDNHLAHTHVFCDGRFHSGDAVVVMFHTCLPFEVFTTHHLRSQAMKLVVTRADCERRRVLELNAAPAAEEYARLVATSPAALTPEIFARHPLAVRIGEQHYVRSIQGVNEDGSLSFYCAVENGIVLTAMRPAPLLEELEDVLAGLRQRLGEPALILGCDCFLRRLELESLDQVEEASQLLGRAGVIGFNTYGEQYHGMHLNQTFTGVAIGSLSPP